MQVLTIKDILRATDGELIAKSANTAELEFTGITTDSRMVGDGVLFVPLAGEKADGHDFIKSALEHGASASLTQRTIENINGGTVIKVNNTRKALGDIARVYKEKYKIPTVAITGSVGKTTTKDMVYSVLSEKFNAHKTPNNFNNDIGLPLTVFGIEAEHETAVLEMGMNHFGEIEYLASIAKPDIAIITNIGMSHIENLGSQEGILRAKLEIAKNFTDKNTLFVNGDDEHLKNVSDLNCKIVKFGMNDGNDVTAKDITSKGLLGTEFTVVCGGREFRAAVTQPGIHNVYNALAAVCAGMYFGLTEEECVRGLKNCRYTSQRLEVISHGGMEIINDCYNSSPDSVKAALKVQQLTLKPRRVAILGDILEMGEYAEKAHFELGGFVAETGVDMLVTAGENAKSLAEGAKAAGLKNIMSYDKTEDVVSDIKNLVKEGDCILIKASHGMRFSEITEAVKAL